MAFRENIAELVERESVNGSTKIDPSWTRTPLCIFSPALITQLH